MPYRRLPNTDQARLYALQTAVKRAAKFLKGGEVVCIMPEGTRHGKSGTNPELHAGVALIARMGRAPILPMTVRR